jgi:hypothetical protein
VEGVDLIPSTRRELHRRRRRVRVWIGAGCAYAALLGGTLVGAAAAWPRDQETPAAALGAATLENEQHRSRTAALAAEIAHKQRELAANKAVGNQPDWSILLALVAEALGPDAALREANLTAETITPPAAAPKPPAPGAIQAEPVPVIDAEPRRSFSLVLTGLARSQGAVNEVVKRLEATGLFERILLIETRREGTDTQAALTSFRFSCQLGPGRASP